MTEPARPTDRPFDGVLLDFDGTVVDTLDLILASYRHTMRTHHGETPPDDVWLAGMGTPLVTQLRALARDETELTAMVDTYRTFNHANHDALARPFEGVRDGLEALHGRVPIALVTSKSRAGVHRGFELFDLARFFEAVVTPDDVSAYKPDPTPVVAAADRLGVAPQRCLMVGDSPHDIAAGRRAGATTAVAGWGAFDEKRLREADPDHWLDTPVALVRLALTPRAMSPSPDR